jgi:hypothetical protein
MNKMTEDQRKFWTDAAERAIANLNLKTLDFTTYYCVFCETKVPQHICTDCNDYALTIDEAIANGYVNNAEDVK